MSVTHRHVAFRQLVRFSIAGVSVAVISVFVYWVAAVPAGINPLIANFLSYATNISLGFLIHRAWTFKELSARGANGRAPLKYFLVSLLALAMNTLWTALLTIALHQPAWTPILPMVFVTPLVTFVVNRSWVFEPSRGG